jgi:hypothetical protein
MKTLFFIFVLIILSCSGNKSTTFIVKGVEDGLKRDCGHHFYTIDRRVEMPPTHWEKYCWYRDFYYRRFKIEETGDIEISPSGRYALFGSDSLGGIFIFDSKSFYKYKVLDSGTGPTESIWNKHEDTALVTYYVDGNTTDSILLVLRNLKIFDSVSRK